MFKVNSYSTANVYGSNENINPIVNPVPATAVPQVFCRYKPHGISQPNISYCHNYNSNFKKLYISTLLTVLMSK